MKRFLLIGIPLLLAAVMLCTIFIPQPVYARPKKFDRSRIEEYYGMEVKIQIGDMIFDGYITKEFTEAELDRLIAESLKEMGMSEKDLDDLYVLAENPNYTPEQARDALVTMLGLGAAGDAANVMKALDQYYKGDHAGANRTMGEITKIRWLNPKKTIEDIANEWNNAILVVCEQQQTFQITKFYSLLSAKIFRLLRDREWVLNVANAKATKQFQFLKKSLDEEWTMNMVLKQRRNANGEINGQYEGDFTIEIKYAVDNLPNIFAQDHIDNVMRAASSQLDWKASLTNPGTSKVTRKLTGSAVATINFSKSSIAPSLKYDDKDINIEGIVVHDRGDHWNGDHYDMDRSYWAKTTGIFYKLTNQVATTHDGTSIPMPDSGDVWTDWEDWGDIWKRGDNGDKGWLLLVKSW